MTEPTDFELMVERRMRAYAATVAHPVPAREIARTTIAAAAAPVGRRSALGGPRRHAMLAGLATMLLLAAVAGVAIIGGRTSPIHGAFVEGPSLSDGRIVNAVALADGRVLVGVRPEEGIIPGTTTFQRRCSTSCLPYLTLLDPGTGAFTPTREPAPSPAFESMVLLRDGRVLLVNGSPPRAGDDPSADMYDPVADRFEAVGAPFDERWMPFLVTLLDGRVLVGGGEAGGALATTELFDPMTGTFSPAGSMARSRSFGASATLLPDGRVLIVGGGAEVGTSAELFDPATGTFTPTGPTTVARGGFHSATLLANGRVLIAGGIIPRDGDPRAVPDPTATAEVYDPATGTFSAVGPMAAPRFLHAASILADGTVLVAGGGHELQPDSPPDMTADAEVFDPTTGTFRSTGSLHRPRLLPVAVSVDDRVLILGHLDPEGAGGTAATTEWFD